MNLLQSALLGAIPNVVHGYTTRRADLPDFGNVSPFQGDPKAAIQNRADFMGEIGVNPEHLTLAFQEHGARIHRVTRAERGAGSLDRATSLPGYDGLVTDEAEVPLAAMTADCACLLIAHREGRAVGVFHAGWRGVLAEMPSRAVKSFEEHFGIEPAELAVWIGPMISANRFEVGREVWDLFNAGWRGEFCLEGPLRVDLRGLIVHQLRESGIHGTCIEDCGICTYDNPGCFSHRRNENPNGRMMGVIGLKK